MAWSDQHTKPNGHQYSNVYLWTVDDEQNQHRSARRFWVSVLSDKTNPIKGFYQVEPQAIFRRQQVIWTSAAVSVLAFEILFLPYGFLAYYSESNLSLLLVFSSPLE